jgi:hypothetical protein
MNSLKWTPILKNAWTWLGVFSLALSLLGVSYPTLRTKVEEMVTNQIAQKFAEPRIRETFQEAANTKGRELLLNEIQPVVTRFRADLQKEYQAVYEEVSRIRIQNNLPVLGGKAILQGGREAFEKIIRVVKSESEMNSLKKAAIEETSRVVMNLSDPSFMIPALIITLNDSSQIAN